MKREQSIFEKENKGEKIEGYGDIAESKIPSKKRLKRQGQVYREMERENKEDGNTI